MMNNIKEEAQTLIDQGYKIIPLIENEKGNRDKEILTREYLLDDFDRLEKQHNKLHTNLGITAHASTILDPTFQPPWINVKSAWQREFIKKFCEDTLADLVQRTTHASRLEYFFSVLSSIELQQ